MTFTFLISTAHHSLCCKQSFSNPFIFSYSYLPQLPPRNHTITSLHPNQLPEAGRGKQYNELKEVKGGSFHYLMALQLLLDWRCSKGKNRGEIF